MRFFSIVKELRMSIPKISIRKVERELFEAKQPQLTLVAPHRITCRACERVGDQVESGILLCTDCAVDIDALKKHVRITLASYHARIGETWGALEQAIPESPYQLPDGRYVSEAGETEDISSATATDPLRRRWDAFQDAQGKPAAQQAIAMARSGMQGPLADLIRLWCAYKDAMGIYAERKSWADKVDTQIAFYADEIL